MMAIVSELPAQECDGALLDGTGDLSHLVRARVGGEHAAHQVQGGAMATTPVARANTSQPRSAPPSVKA